MVKGWEKDLADVREALDTRLTEISSKNDREVAVVDGKLEVLGREISEMRSTIEESINSLKLMVQSTLNDQKGKQPEEVPKETPKEAVEAPKEASDIASGIEVGSSAYFDIEAQTPGETAAQYTARLRDSFRILYRDMQPDETDEDFRHRANLRRAADQVRREVEAYNNQGLPVRRGPTNRRETPIRAQGNQAQMPTDDRSVGGTDVGVPIGPPVHQRGRTAPYVRYGSVVPEEQRQSSAPSSWETRMQSALRHMIRERVGEDPPPHATREHLRALKMPLPSPQYEGEDDLLVFQQWLLGLLRWLSTYMLVGPSNDEHRRRTLPMCLGGEAIKWYNTTIDSPYMMSNWTFEEVILALHAQFITRQAAIDSAFRFKSHKYRSTDGVLKFHRELVEFASQMVHPPDDFSFKTKFMEELPYDIVQHIVQIKGLSFEMNNLDELLGAALDWEGGDKALRTWQKKKPVWGSYRPRTTPVAESSVRTPIEAKTPSKGSTPTTTTPKPVEKGTTAETEPKTRVRDYSKMECWDCHVIGHRAGDPKCTSPKTGPRLRSARVVEREIDSEEEQVDHQFDGSQYDSAEEPDVVDDALYAVVFNITRLVWNQVMVKLIPSQRPGG
jgi:hypothetical protein